MTELHHGYMNSTFDCHSPGSLKLIRKLWLALSHLQFHKFKYNFQDTLNPVWSCGTFETTIHYLLHCPNFSNENHEKLTPFNKIQSIDDTIWRKDISIISKVQMLTDQFMLKESCRYIYTKQSATGLYPADKLDGICQIKFDFHTCHSSVPISQASRRNFYKSFIYTDIMGYHQSTGHSWDGDGRSTSVGCNWQNNWCASRRCIPK